MGPLLQQISAFPSKQTPEVLPEAVNARNHVIWAAWTLQPSSALHHPLTLSQPVSPPQPPLTFSRQFEPIKHARHMLSPWVRGCRTQPALGGGSSEKCEPEPLCTTLPEARGHSLGWRSLAAERSSHGWLRSCAVSTHYFSVLTWKAKYLINLILQSLLMFTLFKMLSLFSKIRKNHYS